jgi:hypothetical protein
MKNLTKIKFVVVGSLVNVAVKIQNEIENNHHIKVEDSYIHICTSSHDIRETIPHIMLGNGQGSGGDRAESFEFFKKNKPLLEKEFESTNTLYVIIGGANGGTSTVLPMVLPLIGQKALLMIMTEDSTHGLSMQNTLKSYQSVAGYAQKKRSIPLLVSKVDGDIATSDAEILQHIKALGLFLSPIEKMDENDVLNLFRFDKLINIKSQKKLYGFSLTADTIESVGVIATRELVVDGNYTGKTESIEGELVKQGHTPYLTKMYTSHKLIIGLTRNVFDQHIAYLTEQVEKDKLELVTIKPIEVPVPSNLDEIDDEDDFLII